MGEGEEGVEGGGGGLVKLSVAIIQFLQVSKVAVYDFVGRYLWKKFGTNFLGVSVFRLLG